MAHTAAIPTPVTLIEPKLNLYYIVRHSLGKKKTRGNHSVPGVTDVQILEDKSVYCLLI